MEANLKRHVGVIPRWDTPDVPRTDPGYIRQYGYDTLCMELWAHRTIDNHSASPIGLHIIEGVYGRSEQGMSRADIQWTARYVTVLT